MPTIGAVTIGQSPRDDVLPEIVELLPHGTQVIESGALDFVATPDLGSLTPAAGDDALVTRLRNGQEVKIAEARLRPLLQSAVDEVCERGADLVAVLCTGTLAGVRCPVRALLPGPIVRRLVSGMTGGQGRLAVIVPDSSQLEAARREWAPAAGCLQVLPASPYRAPDEIAAAVRTLTDWRPDLVVLDCLGFGRSMQCLVQDSVRAPVLLPRAALAGAITAPL